MIPERFGKALSLAARLTKTELSTDILDFYVKALAPLGMDRASDAIEKLCEDPRHFPTVAEIKQFLGVAAIDPKARATALANEVWGILERGVTHTSIAKASPEAAELARRLGGFRALSDHATYDDKIALIAQWRDTALAMPADMSQWQTLPPSGLAERLVSVKTLSIKGRNE